MENHECYNAYREALVSIQLIIGGAIMLYENEGKAICSKMKEEELGRLSYAMESLGQALRMAHDQASTVLLHEIV